MPKYLFILYCFLVPFLAKSQTADFTFQSSNGLLCNPATVQFTQTATGSPIGFVWDFGNNTKAYSGNASATYASAGTYIVKLIVIYDQTKVEVSKTIVINPNVTASIGYDRNYICMPGVINFTGASNGSNITYAWDFGDATGTFTTVTNSQVHNFTAFGNYTVSLKATDTTGCMGTDSKTIQVLKPPIVASVSPASGCIPANTSFNASVNVPVNDNLTSYSWNFGDGTPALSTLTGNINHLYNAAGSYSPTLNITTNNGCTNTFNFPVIAYGTPPINHVAYPKKAVVCGSETPVFVAKATNANSYYWDFGDGGTAGVSDTITQHKYGSLGTKNVTVTPYYNGCPGTTISFQIDVVGVIASYTFANTCTNRKTYSFTNFSQGTLSSVLWTFGDSSATASTIHTTHTFPTSGQFVTSLNVIDSTTGCSDNYSQTVYTANPSLVNLDTSICRNSNTNFSILNFYTSPSATYTWNVAGLPANTTSSPAITVKASILGNFNNFVSINYGPQSCTDTVFLSHSILVKGPDLSFNAPSDMCVNSTIIVTNTSKPFVPKDSVKLWYWNFGNKTANDTAYQPPSIKYTSPGSYNIKLIGMDINGCTDSLTKVIKVNRIPFLVVVPHIDTLCFGQSDTVRAFASDSLLWSPTNNITCSNCDSVVANPSVTTQYIITSTTPENCSVRDSALIKVYTPFTASAPSSNLYICQNDQVQLDMNPKMKRITWAPAGSLSNSSIYDPIASPLQNTTFTATLTDSVGCNTSTASVNVFVKSLPTVNAGPDKILPYNSAYSITPTYSNNVQNYSWTPSLLLDCNNCATPNGTALYSQKYLIKVTSDSGCVASDSINVFVECKYANILMPNAFTPNNDNLNDTYFPVTRGIKSITKFAIYNRQGQLIYEVRNVPANSKSFAWNGDFKGQYQPAAAYVFVLEVLCEVGQTITKTGSFLLLR
ncbi:MAG: PKD domain-containing protein [Ferruginibacter sp.]